MNKRYYYHEPYYMHNHRQTFHHQPNAEQNFQQYNPTAYQTPYELFAKPAQPPYWQTPEPMQNSFNQQSGQVGSNMFTDSQGQLDFDKMLSTVGQLASTYHQVSPIVKQLSSLMRMFRA